MTDKYTLQIRTDAESFAKFRGRCRTMNRTHTDVLREIITAFNEERLKITPRDGAGDLYE